MITKPLASPQTVNACTLISIGVINAILHAKSDSASIEAAIKSAHEQYQAVFSRLVVEGEAGAGVLENEAYRRYFTEGLSVPIQVTLTVPVDDTDKLIDELIANRAGLDAAEFADFNFDKIMTLMLKLRPSAAVNDWFTVTKSELQALIAPPGDAEVPLIAQILQRLNCLTATSGMTLNGGGHTISVTKKEGTYYYFDSQTGVLSQTNDVVEMAHHLERGFCSSHPTPNYETYAFSANQRPVLTPPSGRIASEIPHSPVSVVRRAPQPVDLSRKNPQTSFPALAPIGVSSANHHPRLVHGFFCKTSYKTAYHHLFLTAVVDTPLGKARALLDDYTKGNSFIRRVMHGHWNRHYVQDVAGIVARIDSGKLKNVVDVVTALEAEITIANPHGSLARRIEFIKDQYPLLFNTARQAGPQAF